jgi:hypothetical protein
MAEVSDRRPWFRRLFGNKAPAPPSLPRLSAKDLSAVEARLYRDAEAIVEKYVMATQPVPYFATVLKSDGQYHSFLASDEFHSGVEASASLLEALMPMVWAEEITAAVIVTPMEPIDGYDERGVVFDLEGRGTRRINVVLPYRIPPATPALGVETYMLAPPKLFVEPKPRGYRR